MKVFRLESHISKEKEQSANNIYAFMNVPSLILLIFLFLLVYPFKVGSFPDHTLLDSFNNSVQLDGVGADVVSIAQLLSDPSQYHRKIVKVRGTVNQPELHVDESGLFYPVCLCLKRGREHPHCFWTP